MSGGRWWFGGREWHVECDGAMHGDELPRKIAAGVVEESTCRS